MGYEAMDEKIEQNYKNCVDVIEYRHINMYFGIDLEKN